MNVDEAIMEFRSAMERHGLTFKGELLANQGIQRFHVAGDKPGTRSGWLTLYTNNRPAGAYGCWRLFGSESIKWVADKGAVRATPQERAAFKAKIAADKIQRAAEQQEKHDAAAIEANAIWEAAEPAPDDHPYLVKKGVKSHGLRIADWKIESPPDPHTGEIRMVKVENALIVPIKRGKKIVSLQGIFPNDKNALKLGKIYFRDGQKKGGCFLIGKRPAELGGVTTLLLAEGYATAATLHEATGMSVVTCFDSGNLVSVAQFCREHYPASRIVIAADNDCWGIDATVNPGANCATKAAEAVGGIVIIPKFRVSPHKPTDFNDLAADDGLEEVKYQIEAGIKSTAAIDPKADVGSRALAQSVDGYRREARLLNDLKEFQ